VLVVFDSHAKLKWASRSCPKLLQLFSAYVDVQKFAADVSDNRQPRLRHRLRSLGLFDSVPNPKKTRPHRAGNDAVYALAILATLSSRSPDDPSLVIDKNPKRPRLFYGRPQRSKAYPFTVQIRTFDCTPLPLELDTAGKVYSHFSSFNPILAGTGLSHKSIANDNNSQGQQLRNFLGSSHKSSPNKEQLSWSWICFSTKNDLDAFIFSTNHATFNVGKKTIVESHYFHGITLTAEERKAKQLGDREKIREERRKATLLAETLGAN